MASFPFSLGTFRLEECQLLIGPIALSGFGPGDVITFTPEKEGFDWRVGADGKVDIFSVNDPRAKCKIIVGSQSLALGQLWALYTGQLIGPGIAALPFRYFDPSTGTLVQDAQAVIAGPPTQAIGNNPGNRTFDVMLPYAMLPGNCVMNPGIVVP